MKLTHLDRNAGKRRKQTFFTVADDTRDRTSLRNNMIYSLPICIYRLVIHILSMEIDPPFRVPEDDDSKTSTKVGSIHYHYGLWRINYILCFLIVIQLFFHSRMTDWMLLAEFIDSLLMIYIVLPNLSTDVSFAVSSFVVEDVVTI